MFVKEPHRNHALPSPAWISALVGQAERVFGIPMPGMTHMQHAQPILFSHFPAAARRSVFPRHGSSRCGDGHGGRLPDGPGALAGCALDVDRGAIARQLGFARPTANSLDAERPRFWRSIICTRSR